LQRGEKIELLVNKTETLSNNAFKFKKSSTALKRAMWWKNIKLILLIVVILIVRDPCIFIVLTLETRLSFIYWLQLSVEDWLFKDVQNKGCSNKKGIT
jgi:vesicle-associated membrane protein 7